MIAEAIKHIFGLGAQQIQQVHGRAYARDTDGKLSPVSSPESMAAPLEFHSLSGLAAYVASSFASMQDEGQNEHALVVDGPAGVRYVSSLTTAFRQREVLATAAPFLSPAFPFGRYLDLETFVTSLQSSFVQDAQTAAILKLVGNIKGEDVQTVEDDGVSQRVTARTGVATVGKAAVPNPVILSPFRTFPEINQPFSRYVLRLQQGDEGELPEAALFEVGDCQWKHEAAADIAARLGELLAGSDRKVQIFS